MRVKFMVKLGWFSPSHTAPILHIISGVKFRERRESDFVFFTTCRSSELPPLPPGHGPIPKSHNTKESHVRTKTPSSHQVELQPQRKNLHHPGTGAAGMTCGERVTWIRERGKGDRLVTGGRREEGAVCCRKGTNFLRTDRTLQPNR
jgi:hypothetical protein